MNLHSSSFLGVWLGAAINMMCDVIKGGVYKIKMLPKYRYLLPFFLIAIVALFYYEWYLFCRGIPSLISIYKPFWVPKKLLIYSIFSLLMLALCLIKDMPYNLFRLVILILIVLSFYSFYHCGKSIRKEINLENKTYSEFFQNKRNIDRVIILNSDNPFSDSFSSSMAMHHETPALGGMFFAPLRRYSKFIRLLDENFFNFQGEQDNYLISSYPLETTDFINEDNLHIINMVNIKYLAVKGFIPKITVPGENSVNPFHLVVDKDIKIYVNKDALDRAYIVHKMTVITDENHILKELKNPQFNYRDCVILEENNWEKDESSEDQLVGDITYFNKLKLAKNEYTKIIEYSTNSQIVETNILRDGFLVLSEAYYPGWKVFIDGVQGHIYRANYLFRAVFLKRGIHTVQFVYQPVTLFRGAVIAVISLTILVSMCALVFLDHLIKKKK